MLINKFLLYMINNRIIRYIFFGGLTTFVNLFSYFIFRTLFVLKVNTANIISIIIAILFAYIVNSKFVFKSKCNNIKEKLRQFIKFINARISTMGIEIAGVFILTEVVYFDDLVSKVSIQVVVLILNYIFSKKIVFK